MGNLLSRKEKRYAQANGLCLVKSITSFLLMRREKMKKKMLNKEALLMQNAADLMYIKCMNKLTLKQYIQSF